MARALDRFVRRRDMGRGAVACLGMLALAATLGACEGVSESLGLGKRAPDEFAVMRSAPLTLPPDFSLRPPQPGAPRPNEASPREQAESVLLDEAGASPSEAGAAAASEGESALIQRAGAAEVSPDIRLIVDREFSDYASENQSYVDELLFWRPDQPLGEVIDAEAEAQRLRENAALGKPATEGETPTIKRRDRALLEGIFN